MARNESGQEDGDAKLRFGRGVDNRTDTSRVEAGFARVADNVDISRTDAVTPREGSMLKASIVGAHSVKAFDGFPFALAADVNSLYRLDTDYNVSKLLDGLNGNTVYYESLGNRVFWSNGVQSGIVLPSGTVAPWGVETPLPSFAAIATSTGGLFAGRYAVTATFGASTGEEGGAPEPVYVDVPDGGGIQLQGLPVPQTSAPQSLRIYRSEVNSPDLLYAQSAPLNVGQWNLGAQMLGRPLTTLLKDPMPPAIHLLAKSGRIFGAVGNRLLWTDPLYYGVTDLANNFKLYASSIRMIAAPDSSRFILYLSTAEKIYRLEGDSIDTATQAIVQSKGCVPGSMVMVPPEAVNLDRVLAPVPVWVGGEGIPYAGTEEGVMPLHDKFVYPLYDEASAAFIQRNGANRYLVAGRGGRRSDLAVTDSATLTVIP